MVVVGDDLPGPPTVVTDELGEGSREAAGTLGCMEVVRDQGVLDVAGQDEDAAVGVAPLVGIEVLPGAPVEDRVLVEKRVARRPAAAVSRGVRSSSASGWP